MFILNTCSENHAVATAVTMQDIFRADINPMNLQTFV